MQNPTHQRAKGAPLRPGSWGFLDQYVKLISWQARAITMTDGLRVRIVHEPALATRPSIRCAQITASLQEDPLEGAVVEAPETDSGGLEACGSALVDRAECSAQNWPLLRYLLQKYGKVMLLVLFTEARLGAMKLDGANPIRQWQESNKKLRQSQMDHVTNTEREKRGPVLFYEIKARFGRFHASHLYDMFIRRC
ncbi:hypothetical protein T4B_8547 [Trichinella pseudospiralis]|uniref:Uncharacterized protein n=1 Tax=Trichinella pseudospiralis TaxID=6337 RepID=A0A0V1H606_TRIPS|nr:hypothetical protein T4A_481 [Trichinella pseudospiralis]KRZ05915.1 hypothetical protein T4B_8547 [Trichinella pseudospiralis]